jgi:hypothetical protein
MVELAALSGPGGEAELQEYTRALDSMLRFTTLRPGHSTAHHKTSNQTELSNHQHALADLWVDDEFMRFVSRPFHPTLCEWSTQDLVSPAMESWQDVLIDPSSSAYNSLARRCYSIIRQMCNGNHTIGYHFAAKYKDQMLIHCQLMTGVPGVDWDIVSVLQAMYTDNLLLIQTLSQTDLQIYAKLIKDAVSVREHRMILKLVSLMCAYRRTAIVDAQDAIRSSLKEMIPKTRINSRNAVEIQKLVPDLHTSVGLGGQKMAEVVEEMLHHKGDVWRSIEDFADSSENQLYLVTLTELLTNLCLDRRRESQEFIKESFAPFKTALLVLTNRNIHSAVRAGFISLVRKVYIDADPFESNPINLARMWWDVTDENGARYLASEIEKVVPDRPNWVHDLMDWSSSYFEEEGPHLVIKPTKERRFGSGGRRSSVESNASLRSARPGVSTPRERLLGGSRGSTGGSAGGIMRMGSTGSFEAGGRGWGKVRVKLTRLNKETRDRDDVIGQNVLCCQVLGLLGDMVLHGFCTDEARRVKVLQVLLHLLRQSPRSPNGTLEDALEAPERNAITAAKKAACDLLHSLNKIWASNTFLPELLTAFKGEYDKTDGKHMLVPAEGWLKKLPSFAEQDKAGGFCWFRKAEPNVSSETDTDVEVVCILLDLCQYGDAKLTESALRLLMSTFNLKGEIMDLLKEVSFTADADETRSSALAELRRRKTLWFTAVHKDVASSVPDLLELLEWFSAQLDCRLGEQTLQLHQKMIRGERIHLAVLQLLREQVGAKNEEELASRFQANPDLRRLLEMAFAFLGSFAADNVANQAEFVSADIFRFIVGASTLGIGAEMALMHILNHADAVRMVRTGISRTLVHNLFLFERCRTPQYLEMLKVIVAPKGTTSEEQQTEFVTTIITAKQMMGADEGRHSPSSTNSHFPNPASSTGESAGGNRRSRQASIDELEEEIFGDAQQLTPQQNLATLWRPENANLYHIPASDGWLLAVADALGRKAAVIEKLNPVVVAAMDPDSLLLAERVHPRTGARYKESFFGDDFCQVLISKNLAKTKDEAAAIGDACIETGLMYRLGGGFGLHDFENGKVLYRFASDKEGKLPEHVANDSKEFVCDYYLALARLLSTVCDFNPYTRGILISEAPFDQVLAPMLSRSFPLLPTKTKTSYIGLAHSLHLYMVAPEELFDERSVVKLSGVDGVEGGRVTDGITTATSDRIFSLMEVVTVVSSCLDAAGAQLTSWVTNSRGSVASFRARKQEAFEPDTFIIGSVVPFCIELLLHSAKLLRQAWECGGEVEAKSWTFRALLSSLIERMVDFFERRNKGPNMKLADRERGSALIEVILRMTEHEHYASLRTTLFTGTLATSVTNRLETALSWWKGEAEYATQIIEEQAIAARVTPANETEQVADRMHAFRYQIDTMMRQLGDHAAFGNEKDWLREQDSNAVKYSEFWHLIRIFKKFFLEGAEDKSLDKDKSFRRGSASFRKNSAFRGSASFRQTTDNRSGGQSAAAAMNLRLSATTRTPNERASAHKVGSEKMVRASRSSQPKSHSLSARISARLSSKGSRGSKVSQDPNATQFNAVNRTWHQFVGMFDNVFGHFVNEHRDSEVELELANGWLLLLCGLIAKEDESDQSKWNQRFIAKTLNQLGLPRLVLGLMAKSKTASFAARLGTELCKCSPVETAIEEDPEIAMVHPHSQRAFYKQFNNDVKRTHRALVQFKQAVGVHIEKIHRKTVVNEMHGLEASNADSESFLTDVHDVHDVVEFLRYLCMGCYSEMQGILLKQSGHVSDSVNVLELITDLAHVHGKVVIKTLKKGFTTGANPHSKAFPLFACPALRNELKGCELLVQLYRLITEVASGPNVKNQDSLMAFGVVEQILPVLMYMEAGTMYSGKAIDDVVEACERDFNIWQREFGVVQTGDDWGQSPRDAADPATSVPMRLLGDVRTLRLTLDRLGTVDEECETHILAAVSALMEGRGSGHGAFDTICHYLFGDVRAVNSVTLNHSTLMSNLTSHYNKAVEDGSIETHENGTAGASALAYYVLLAQLGFNAHDYGLRVNDSLELWNKAEGYPFDKRVGRLELVQDNTLMSIYFPVPANITRVNNSAVVNTLKQSIIDETYLLNDQERVRSFLEHAPLVMQIVKEQSGYQDHILRRWLALEGGIISGAFGVSVALNVMFVAEFDVENPTFHNRHYSWIILGFVHLIFCVLMAVAFVMNHITIDSYHYNEFMKKQSKQSGFMAFIQTIVATCGFWMFSTSAFYMFLNVFCSLLGNFVHKGFFVLGVYGITGKVDGMGLIVKAIFASTPKLMSTVGLAFVVLYTLSVIGETLYKGLYTWPDTETICENNGTTFAECFRDHIYTFGERAVFFKEIPNFGGFLFAVFYNLAVPFLLSGIIVGIITDTFGQMRQRAQEIMNAKQGYCYSCSHSRQELEHDSLLGFDGHVRFDHNPWDFISFVVHAEEKYARHEHLTGPEMHALKLNIQHKLNLMWPFHRALCIDGPQVSSKDHLIESIARPDDTTNYFQHGDRANFTMGTGSVKGTGSMKGMNGQKKASSTRQLGGLDNRGGSITHKTSIGGGGGGPGKDGAGSDSGGSRGSSAGRSTHSGQNESAKSANSTSLPSHISVFTEMTRPQTSEMSDTVFEEEEGPSASSGV